MAISPLSTQQTPFKPEIKQRTQQALQQTLQQRSPDQTQQIGDQTQLSDELVEEVGKTLETQGGAGGQSLDSMLSALTQNFLDKKEQQDPQAVQGVNGAGKAEGGGKKKERTIDWRPTVRRGEVIGAHDKIGDVTITDRESGGDQDKTKKVQGAGKGHKAQQQTQAGKGGTPVAGGTANAKGPAPVGGAQKGAQTKNNPNEEDDKETDKAELSPESQAMAAQMQAQGLKIPGVTPGEESGGAQQQNASVKEVGGVREKSRQAEVFTKAGGVNQTVDVHAPGQVRPGEAYRTYRKLDDMPDDEAVKLKYKTGEEAVDEQRRKIERGEMVKPLTQAQQQKLISPIANQ